MKRFRFPLERLERLREHREKIARRELAERLAEVAAHEASLVRIDRNIEVCNAEGGRARLLGQAIEAGLTAARIRIGQRVQAARQAAEFARAGYAERRRDLHALRSLREHREATWREDVLREEQAELDEMARLRYSAARAEAKPEGGVEA